MSTAAAMDLPRVQRPVLVLAVAAAALLLVHLLDYGLRHAVLLPIGIGLGVSLYHAAFGFSAAYRRALVDRDISGIAAQLIMIAVAIVLFAPVLAQGTAFGRGIGGAVAPVSVSMALGAFVFGVGMQLAGGCASGTLYTVGGGSTRMAVVLAFFCVGGFWASLDLHWWSALPGIGAVLLPEMVGWEIGVAGPARCTGGDLRGSATRRRTDGADLGMAGRFLRPRPSSRTVAAFCSVPPSWRLATG